jgi:hypothetical protein
MPFAPSRAARRPSPRRVALVALAGLAVSAHPLPGQAPAQPRVEVSGLLNGSYQYHVTPDAGSRAGSVHNQFLLDRSYLTVRATAGERGSARLTSDLFRNGSEGYDLRVKYGYGQYDFLRRGDVRAFVRAGILQTVMIEEVETFWPRWLGPVAEDRFGFFSSADVGVSSGLTLPRQLGELYATVTNGRGYSNAGTDDRFKDVALRVSLTPLARRADAGLLRTLTVSPWYYKGDTASSFATTLTGGDVPDGYLGRIDAGRQRDRYGVFAGIRDPRLSALVGISERRSEVESGANTATSPVVLTTQRDRLVSAFVVARPLAFADSAAPPVGVVLRVDRLQPRLGSGSDVRYVFAGLTYDLNRNISVSANYQETSPRRGPPTPLDVPMRAYFGQFTVRF